MFSLFMYPSMYVCVWTELSETKSYCIVLYCVVTHRNVLYSSPWSQREPTGTIVPYMCPCKECHLVPVPQQGVRKK